MVVVVVVVRAVMERNIEAAARYVKTGRGAASFLDRSFQYIFSAGVVFPQFPGVFGTHAELNRPVCILFFTL